MLARLAGDEAQHRARQGVRQRDQLLPARLGRPHRPRRDRRRRPHQPGRSAASGDRPPVSAPTTSACPATSTPSARDSRRRSTGRHIVETLVGARPGRSILYAAASRRLTAVATCSTGRSRRSLNAPSATLVHDRRRAVGDDARVCPPSAQQIAELHASWLNSAARRARQLVARSQDPGSMWVFVTRRDLAHPGRRADRRGDRTSGASGRGRRSAAFSTRRSATPRN